MKQDMLKSDIAIASGGQTLYELANVGLPAIAIILIDNQVEDTVGWAQKGFLYNAGWWNKKQLENNIINYLKKLMDYSMRKSMGEIGQLFVDGKGANRIVEFTIERFNENSFRA